jgi:hypothetical protein
MRALLTSDLCGWPTERVESLQDVAAPHELARHLVEMVKGVQDVLLLYYAGHGMRTASGQLALALRDSSADPELLPHTAILYEAIARILRGCPATTKLVILDCCHAELGNKANYQFQSADIDAEPVDGLYFIGASKQYEKARSPLSGGLPYFTNAFIEVVGTGIPGNPPQLTIDQIFTELRSRMLRANLPEPMQSGIRDAHRWPFARNAARPETHRDLDKEIASLLEWKAAAEARERVLQAEVAERTAEVQRLREQVQASEPRSVDRQQQLHAELREAHTRLGDAAMAQAAAQAEYRQAADSVHLALASGEAPTGVRPAVSVAAPAHSSSPRDVITESSTLDTHSDRSSVRRFRLPRYQFPVRRRWVPLVALAVGLCGLAISTAVFFQTNARQYAADCRLAASWTNSAASPEPIHLLNATPSISHRASSAISTSAGSGSPTVTTTRPDGAIGAYSGSALADPGGIAVANCIVWVASQSNNSVTELDASNGHLIRTLSGKSYSFDSPNAIAADPTHVWVVNGGNNSVTELSSSGSVVGVLSNEGYEVASQDAIADDGKHVWIVNGSSSASSSVLIELDASSGRRIRTIDHVSDADAIAVQGNDVWLTNYNDNSVMELDANTGHLKRVLSGGNYGFNASWGIADDGTHVWVTNSYENSDRYPHSTVTELDAGTGQWIRTLSGGHYTFSDAGAVAMCGSHIWVANDNSVTELDASTGQWIKTFSNPASSFDSPNWPLAMAVDGNDLWIANSQHNIGPGSVTELACLQIIITVGFVYHAVVIGACS